MKVLFLDIDGVLNSSRTATAFGGYPHSFDQMGDFDHAAVGLIRALCRGGDVKIILSSAWRVSYTAEQAAAALGLPIIDRTPYLTTTARGCEINAWLGEHPEVTAFAIVDDDDDMLPEQRARFVRTSHSDGLSFGDYEQLCALLSVDPVAGVQRERGWNDGAKLQWEGAAE